MDGYEIKIMFQNTLFGDVTLVDQKTKALLLFFLAVHRGCTLSRCSANDLVSGPAQPFDACATSAALYAERS
jgi:hypothetical protein